MPRHAHLILLHRVRLSMCACTCATHSLYVEVRGQLVGISLTWVPGVELTIVGLSGKCLDTLSHLYGASRALNSLAQKYNSILSIL